jgi:hypothetical protein
MEGRTKPAARLVECQRHQIIVNEEAEENICICPKTAHAFGQKILKSFAFTKIL